MIIVVIAFLVILPFVAKTNKEYMEKRHHDLTIERLNKEIIMQREKE